jgi:hypothetical protein
VRIARQSLSERKLALLHPGHLSFQLKSRNLWLFFYTLFLSN